MSVLRANTLLIKKLDAVIFYQILGPDPGAWPEGWFMINDASEWYGNSEGECD